MGRDGGTTLAIFAPLPGSDVTGSTGREGLVSCLGISPELRSLRRRRSFPQAEGPLLLGVVNRKTNYRKGGEFHRDRGGEFHHARQVKSLKTKDRQGGENFTVENLEHPQSHPQGVRISPSRRWGVRISPCLEAGCETTARGRGVSGGVRRAGVDRGAAGGLRRRRRRRAPGRGRGASGAPAWRSA